MNTQKIKDLILRYENGETNLEEERYLRSAFKGINDIPFELRHYSPIFGFYENAGIEEFSDPSFDEKLLLHLESDLPKNGLTKNINKRYSFIAFAASIAILFGLYFSGIFNSGPKDTYDDPLLAYAETKKILMEVSGKMNSGFSELENIHELNSGMSNLNPLAQFDTGMKNFKKISVLNKSQNTITNKNN